MPSTSLALPLEQLKTEARALIKEHNMRFRCTGLRFSPHDDLYSVLADEWPDSVDARRALREMNSGLARAGFRGFSIAPEEGALIMRFDCRR